MSSKKSFVKGLAAGAVLGAVAAMLHSIKDKDKAAQDLKKSASRISDKVANHAKRLGKLSKAAYDKVVDTTVAEYRGVKALTEDELDELKKELKAGWSDVKEMVEKRKKK